MTESFELIFGNKKYSPFFERVQRIVYEKLDNARSRCLSLRRTILSPSGVPKSLESPLSETASETGSVSSLGGGFTDNVSDIFRTQIATV